VSERAVKSKKTRQLAEKALDKKPALGEDIDIASYSSSAEEHPYQKKPSQLSTQDKKRMMEVGVTLDDSNQRGGTFVQMDRSVVHSSSSQEGR